MLGYIFGGIGVVLAAFITVIIIRTLRFKPLSQAAPDTTTVDFDKERATEALRELIRCKTVSYYTREEEDEAEFNKLKALLPRLYHELFGVCDYKELPDRAILIRWAGKKQDSPIVLMSHYDVVPVSLDMWQRPPFGAELVDGVIWGRGTLDTKVTFNASLSAACELIKSSFVPENDVYFAFSGGEEVNGRGAVNIVDYFEKEGITPALVLDEGGAVVENVFPGVRGQVGLIGIAEKGMIDLKYTVKSRGGHASAPPRHTPVGELSMACCRVENHPFHARMTKPVKEMFDTLGRNSSFLFRMIFANLWCFGWILNVISRNGGDINALLKTTVAFTQMEGSATANVIPPEASMLSNMRLNPADTVESAIERIRKTVKNDRVELTAVRSTNPSRISATDSEGYRRVALAVASTWQGAIVSPYLMTQCSDSRHWGRISDKVYRFSAMDLTKEERSTIHGHDERIRVDCAMRAVEFYIRLIKQC